VCHFISVIMPVDTSLSAAKAILDKFHMAFLDVDNQFVEQQFDGDRLFFLKGDNEDACHCGTVLGRDHPERLVGPRADTSVADFRKLKKKGWSQSKIERALSQKAQTTQRHEKERAQKYETEMQKWQEFLTASLSETGFCKRLGLLLHFYSGSLSDEQFRIKRTERLPLSAKLESSLLTMEDDVLYMISAR